MKYNSAKLNWIGEKALLEIADTHQSDKDSGITTTEIKDRAGLRAIDNVGGRLNNQFDNMQEMGETGLITGEQLSRDEYDGSGIPPNRWRLTDEGERILFENGLYERLKARHTSKDYEDAALDDEISMLTADLKALEHRFDRFENLVEDDEHYVEPVDEPDVVTIEDRLSKLNGEIGGIKSRLKSLSEKIENPADYYDSQPPGYDQIQREIRRMQEDIEQLQSSVNTLESSVNRLESDMDFIRNRGENGNGVLSYEELLQLTLMLEEVVAAQNVGLEHVQLGVNNKQVDRLERYFQPNQ